MPTLALNSRCDGVSMPSISQIVIMKASANCHRLGEASCFRISDNITMSDSDKNGGPNHLRAWRMRREMTQEDLAEKVGTKPNVIGYLESGERGLSAKWLRRLAPALDITPGLLLDHDPAILSNDMIDMWVSANKDQKKQMTDMAKIILKRDGTDG